MEKNIEARKSGWFKAALLAGGLGLGALTLAGCVGGQTTPPTTEQVEKDLKFFELDNVQAANGEPVRCIMYGSQSEGTQISKSWFGFVCDFEGTATFPSELVAPTTTTTTR